MGQYIPDQFFDVKYDSRNKPQAGEYRGVGQKGKVGAKYSSPPSLDTKGKTDQVPPLKFN